MAYKGSCTTLAKVADDEPIFVLRAQDVSAPEVIEYWLKLNPQIPEPRRQHALSCVNEMLFWRHRKPAD